MNKKVSLLGIPFDANSSFIPGAALGPPAIRAAFYSESSNMWTENNIDLEHAIDDLGDIEGTQKQIFDSIESRVDGLMNQPLISLGGDHSITFPILKAFSKTYSRISVLHFDAHPDLYHDFEGNPYSHASPFARVMESGLAQRLVQIGIRTANPHQRDQVKKFGVEMIEMKDFRNDLQFSFDSPVYISMDTDGLDPAFAPGVSHPEGGGLSTRDVVRIIQSMKGEVIGADIVELNPTKDVAGITAAALAKILKEICGKLLG